MPRRIGLELRETQQLIKRRIIKDRSSEPLVLTHSQIRILVFINKEEGPVYQKDIEEHLHIRRSTATEMLNVLERDGYIVRSRALHDGRLKEIRITPLTLAVIDEMDQYLDKLEDILRENIKKKDLDVFFEVLDKIKRNIDLG
ncbi:MAG: winged helix-turn-helix transcriptional regulator [Synergistaceae bacterium]|nr:winged helix-turn-helix transcriptional regulator [Synergistaceae bacterium]